MRERVNRRRREIEVFLYNTLKDHVLTAKEYESKTKILQECDELIVSSFKSEEQER
jgi:hypothetical protein